VSGAVNQHEFVAHVRLRVRFVVDCDGRRL